MPRDKEQNQLIRDNRKEQILSNSLSLFAKKGLSATKIKDITSATGISQGLIYHYYESKEAIFVELIKIAFERINQACQWLESQPMTPSQKIVFAIEELLRLLEEDEDAALFHLLIAKVTGSDAIPEEARIIIEERNTFPYEAIERIMIEGQKNGSIKDYDAGELALIFWTSINGVAIYKAVHGDKFRSPDANILIEMFIKSH